MKRKILRILFAGLLCFGITAGILYERAVEAYNPNNLIRLHIIPNSDSPVDQELKHRVRRAVVEAMAPEFKEVDNIFKARRLVDMNLAEIQSVAQKQVALAGRDYGVRVYHGRFDFPERTYGGLTLPAGEYEAVRLVLGAGKGQNWWCVLFPPLCLVNIEVSEEVPALAGTPDEDRVKFRSRLWELAERRLGRPLKQVVRSSDTAGN
ncbi:MAG TPA: stage II sporulation protein R [Desulfotomaculum sp.]|nr:stage II sporulation protein R [Desulfotomaculum sp.]